ncbi:hypothetical protein [Pedobacter sp.]|uniref:hypothetical protein n=1 Tax=Pedobacter sp. TaxID=1411316 RepID=UPI003D7F3766
MKKFLTTFIFFILFILISGEIIVRVFKLTPDIPHMYVDKTGIQRYIPGQSGYFADSKIQWHVNQYGWLGIADVKSDSTIAIIGDSYIENMMNPISCNQGTILQSYFKDYAFFEAGRSGVTFIEAMEITKLLDSTVKPLTHLIYMTDDDIYESDASHRLYDRMQLNLKTNTIINGEVKAPGFKKILYNMKVMYYLYLRFPLFVNKKNKEASQGGKKPKKIDVKLINSILSYSSKHYDLRKIVLVFHPESTVELLTIARNYGFSTMTTHQTGDLKNWTVSSKDSHWSCYGHNEVALQIKAQLTAYIKNNEAKSKIALNR